MKGLNVKYNNLEKEIIKIKEEIFKITRYNLELKATRNAINKMKRVNDKKIIEINKRYESLVKIDNQEGGIND